MEDQEGKQNLSLPFSIASCRRREESSFSPMPFLRLHDGSTFWALSKAKYRQRCCASDSDGSQTLAGYDEDSTLSIDYLLSLKTCNGRIGTTGMCLGGHLAYRCALDPRVSAGVTYFATDLHSATLGLGMKDDSLARAGRDQSRVGYDSWRQG